MKVNSCEFGKKLLRLFGSCKTPQQLKVAERYLKLAKRAGWAHGLSFDIDETELSDVICRTRS